MGKGLPVLAGPGKDEAGADVSTLSRGRTRGSIALGMAPGALGTFPYELRPSFAKLLDWQGSVDECFRLALEIGVSTLGSAMVFEVSPCGDVMLRLLTIY